MKIISTLVVSSFILIGCGKQMPEYPSDLKDFHLIEIRGLPMSRELADRVQNADMIPMFTNAEASRCLHFDVVQVNPYQFNFTGIVPLVNCHELGGYKPDENVRLWNWIDDVYRWAEEKKNRP